MILSRIKGFPGTTLPDISTEGREVYRPHLGDGSSPLLPMVSRDIDLPKGHLRKTRGNPSVGAIPARMDSRV
jgi:hypothetical protein